MGKQRDQRQHRHEFELRLARPMRHLLGQSMQAQVERADHEDRDQQKHQDDVEQNVGLPGRGDEHRQVFYRLRMH
ncbi:hypothetical protein D3C84_1286840 [compost metagenome]